MMTLHWTPAAIANYGYAALFLATVVEGPIATVIGAILASQGFLGVIPVYVIAVSGDLVGDLLYYGIGRSGRISLPVWRRALNERHQQRLATLKDSLRAHAGGTLLIGKLTHAAGFVVLLAAGAARVPLAQFLGYNLLGTLPKTAVLVLIGYFAGIAYTRINAYFWVISLMSFPLICIGIFVYLRRRAAFDQSKARKGHAHRGIH